MKTWLWILVGALFLLHQDFWWWNDATLLFGFMPIGLAYHALYSIAAAAVWSLAIHFAWPDESDLAGAGEEDPAS